MIELETAIKGTSITKITSRMIVVEYMFLLLIETAGNRTSNSRMKEILAKVL